MSFMRKAVFALLALTFIGLGSAPVIKAQDGDVIPCYQAGSYYVYYPVNTPPSGAISFGKQDTHNFQTAEYNTDGTISWQYRNFFAFHIPGSPPGKAITGAQLVLRNLWSGNNYAPSTYTVGVVDATNSFSGRAADVGGDYNQYNSHNLDIYNALGGGTPFGSITGDFNPASLDQHDLTIDLNPAAISALNSGAGRSFVFGGYVTPALANGIGRAYIFKADSLVGNNKLLLTYGPYAGPDFSISVHQDFLAYNVPRFKVTVQSLNGFSGPVNLSAFTDGFTELPAPPFLKADWNPRQTVTPPPNGSVSSELVLTIDPPVAQQSGHYALTVRGFGGGLSREVNVELDTRSSADDGAVTAMRNRVWNDPRFGEPIEASLSKNLDGIPDWELRAMAFNFSAGRIAVVFCMTNKTDGKQYTNFLDPDTGTWAGWVQYVFNP